MGLVSRRRYALEREERESYVANWFAGHVATLHEGTLGGVPVQELVWKRPDSRYYALWYLCRGGSLIVTGDMDDAIYNAGGRGLEFWAACSLDYFAGKCVASPHGRRFRTWDERAAVGYVRDLLAQGESDARHAFRARGGWDALGSEYDWSAWLREHGYDVWSDPWEYGNAGMVVDRACYAHLRGLQLALEQLGRNTNARVA